MNIISEKSTENSRPLPITFTNYKYKNSVWSGKKELEGSTIIITEFLTKKRQALYKGSIWYTQGMDTEWLCGCRTREQESDGNIVNPNP
ncbi:hypothetical protein JTB14_025845 [Gonioctena quinquepunctata]|nr:hypothetical protein JTB14_025845 [Gonioctena quinquepunctata]